jgi:hypothetical protein
MGSNYNEMKSVIGKTRSGAGKSLNKETEWGVLKSIVGEIKLETKKLGALPVLVGLL